MYSIDLIHADKVQIVLKKLSLEHPPLYTPSVEEDSKYNWEFPIRFGMMKTHIAWNINGIRDDTFYRLASGGHVINEKRSLGQATQEMIQTYKLYRKALASFCAHYHLGEATDIDLINWIYFRLEKEPTAIYDINRGDGFEFIVEFIKEFKLVYTPLPCPVSVKTISGDLIQLEFDLRRGPLTIRDELVRSHGYPLETTRVYMTDPIPLFPTPEDIKHYQAIVVVEESVYREEPNSKDYMNYCPTIGLLSQIEVYINETRVRLVIQWELGKYVIKEYNIVADSMEEVLAMAPETFQGIGLSEWWKDLTMYHHYHTKKEVERLK